MSIPVFICGYPKSGTTLLAALLDGHSELVVFPEETLYLSMAGRQPGFTPEVGLKWLLEESTVKNLALRQGERPLDGNYNYSNIDFSAFQKRFLGKVAQGDLNHGKVLEALVSAYADEAKESGKRYWVEKTPGHENHLHLAAEWYPDMRALYIVRDPRDVYTSYNRKKQIESDGRKPLRLQNFMYNWTMSIWKWQQYIAEHSGGLLIRYEDLLCHPRETMGLVCRFLEIDYENVLETPTKNGVPWIGNSMHGDKFAGISTKPIGRWKDTLSEYDLAIIEACLAKAMRFLNYQRAIPSVSLALLCRYWLRHSGKKQIIHTLLRLYWPFQLPQRWR